MRLPFYIKGEKMFDSLLAKCLVGGAAVALFAAGFVALTVNGEASVCEDAGYGAYDDNTATCDATGEYASNLIIVTGNTANTPKPELTEKNSQSYNYLKNSVAKNANIKMISVTPNLKVEAIEVHRPETSDAAGFVESVDQTITEINQKISQTPTMDGATYLEAISKAGRDCVSVQLTNNKDDKNNDGAAILVIGSGLSDGGVLNFADNNFLRKDPFEVVSSIERSGELAYDLDDIKIIWFGIGEVEAPQNTLKDKDIDKLQDIYRQILKRRGASEVIFDNVSQEHHLIENNRYIVKPTKVSGIRIFDEKELSFTPDSAELSDKTAARAALSETFDDAKANPRDTIIVTGYMAAGNCSGQADTTLANERAKTVKKFLIENGISNDIMVVNGGIYEPEKSECDASGVWQGSLADGKRKVTIEFE